MAQGMNGRKRGMLRLIREMRSDYEGLKASKVQTLRYSVKLDCYDHYITTDVINSFE